MLPTLFRKNIWRLLFVFVCGKVVAAVVTAAVVATAGVTGCGFLKMLFNGLVAVVVTVVGAIEGWVTGDDTFFGSGDLIDVIFAVAVVGWDGDFKFALLFITLLFRISLLTNFYGLASCFCLFIYQKKLIRLVVPSLMKQINKRK